MPGRSRQSRLPTRVHKAGRKLSVAEQGLVLDMLARLHRPSEIRERLRRETGTVVGLEAIRRYLKVHAEEIEQRRKAWNAGVDKVPLRHRRARVEEYSRLYSLNIRQFWREVCLVCSGQGCVGGTAVPGAARRRCRPCRGTGWTLPGGVAAYEIGDDLESEVLRLTGMPPPPGMDSEAWDRAMRCLRQISEEVGDARPERGEAAETLLAAAEAEQRRAYADQVRRMTSSQFVELCARMTAEREARWEAQQAGSTVVTPARLITPRRSKGEGTDGH